MTEPVLLTIFIIVVFFAVPILQFIINPASFSQHPTAEDSMSVVAQTAAQSIAIFAVVLVIIQFILDNGTIDGYRLLAINVLVLSASFLMVTFIMELVGDIKVLLFHLQLTALRYSGLLLFLGLYFLLLSTDIPDIIPTIFGSFVSITWLAWFIHEAHYLFIKQPQEWEREDMTKKECLNEYNQYFLAKNTSGKPCTCGTSGKLNTYLSVIIFFGASLVLGDYGIRFYAQFLQVGVPHQIIAGFTEPFTTKLIPAVAAVYSHHRYDVPLSYLKSRPYWFALLGGLSLGVFERLLYIVVKDASISPGFVLAPGMHALNAMLIAGLVFRSADNLEGYRFFGQLLAVTVLAMAIRVFWNTWGVVLVHQAFA